MNNLFLKVSLLVSILFAAPAFAENRAEAVKPLEFRDLVVEDASQFSHTFEQALQDPRTARAAVDTVVYDLKHMPELVKDLEYQADAASNGLTQQVVNEVRRRFRVANALMTSIMIDKKIPLEKKKDYIDDVSSAVTDVFFQVVYNPGENRRTAEESEQAGARGLVKLVLKNWVDDATVLFRRIKAAKLKEIDADGREINAGASSVPAISDRIRRDVLTLELIQELQESIHLVLNKLDDNDPVKAKYIPTYWGEKKAPRLIQMRSYDLTAERIAAATYTGFALWGLFMPAWDMVGAFDGGRSEFSLFDSSMIYATFWTSVAALKASTISASAVQQLKKLVKMTKDQTIPPTQGKLGSFWLRLGAAAGVIKDGCESSLSAKR